MQTSLFTEPQKLTGALTLSWFFMNLPDCAHHGEEAP